MNKIKVGDIITYKTDLIKNGIGMVNDIIEITESLDSSKQGQKEYKVCNLYHYGECYIVNEENIKEIYKKQNIKKGIKNEE